MIECPKCNHFFDEDFDFCPYCGTERPPAKICPDCTFLTQAPFMFCPNCGTELISEDDFDYEYGTELISEDDFNLAWGYIDNLIDNEGFHGALAKYERLFDEENLNPKLKGTFKNYIKNHRDFGNNRYYLLYYGDEYDF